MMKERRDLAQAINTFGMAVGLLASTFMLALNRAIWITGLSAVGSDAANTTSLVAELASAVPWQVWALAMAIFSAVILWRTYRVFGALDAHSELLAEVKKMTQGVHNELPRMREELQTFRSEQQDFFLSANNDLRRWRETLYLSAVAKPTIESRLLAARTALENARANPAAAPWNAKREIEQHDEFRYILRKLLPNALNQIQDVPDSEGEPFYDHQNLVPTLTGAMRHFESQVRTYEAYLEEVEAVCRSTATVKALWFPHQLTEDTAPERPQ